MLRKNKFWIILSLFCFLIMILFLLQSYQIPEITLRYLTDSEYRVNYSVTCDIQPCYVHDVFSLIEELFTLTSLDFEYANSISTSIFQFIIPFIGVAVAVVFYRRYISIYKLQMVRSHSGNSFLLKQMLINAFKAGMAVFFAFSCLFVVMKSVTPVLEPEIVTKSFLIDLLTEDFYMNHPYMYYYLEGSVRFFYMPFVYSMFSQCIALCCSTIKQIVLFPCIWYFGLVIAGFALYYVLPDYYVYFSPTAIMSNGDFNHINSLLLLFSASIPLFVGLAVFGYHMKYEEL